MGKGRGGSVRRVLTENGGEEGTLSEHLTQESVQEAIFTNIHRKRFFLIPSGGSTNLFWKPSGTLWLQLHHTDSAGYPQWNL
jgi:hypothetical protein